MRILLLICFAASVFGQNPKLPPDIDPQSNSRLPSIQRTPAKRRGQEGVRRRLEHGSRAGIALQSPIAESIRTLNSGLRATVLGSQMFEICALIAAREFDEGFEWTGHAAGASHAGVSEETFPIPKTACADDALA